MLKLKLLTMVLVLAAIGLFIHEHGQTSAKDLVAAQTAAKTTQAAAKKVQKAVNHCADNKLAQNIIVDISAQHLWACAGTSTKYDSPVVTGMEKYPADLTPAGTYKIYGKQTDQTLKGSDSTGSWSDPVNYWEPFLYNKYGAYGFHDATWRASSDFGNIDINAPFTTTAKSASHGCVELPLTAAKWLYNWSSIGTAVTIQS